MKDNKKADMKDAMHGSKKEGMDEHLHACTNDISLHFHPKQQLQCQCEQSPSSDVNPAMM
jgi:hypothetical protein